MLFLDIPLVPQVNLQALDRWDVDFVGPINTRGKQIGARNIIIATKYLTRKWAKETQVRDCTAATAIIFLFVPVVTRFGCPKILISDQGTDFVNHSIEKLIEEFDIQHRKTTPYHPEENDVVEAFNKILENALTTICTIKRNDWDHKILAVLWDYRST